ARAGRVPDPGDGAGRVGRGADPPQRAVAGRGARHPAGLRLPDGQPAGGGHRHRAELAGRAPRRRLRLRHVAMRSEERRVGSDWSSDVCSSDLLGLGAFLIQVMVQGAWGVVPTHLNELSPDAVRGTLPGFAYQMGNLLAAVTATAQSWLAARHGGDYAFAMSL